MCFILLKKELMFLHPVLLTKDTIHIFLFEYNIYMIIKLLISAIRAVLNQLLLGCDPDLRLKRLLNKQYFISKLECELVITCLNVSPTDGDKPTRFSSPAVNAVGLTLTS